MEDTQNWMTELVNAYDGEKKMLAVIHACSRIVTDATGYFSLDEKNRFIDIHDAVRDILKQKRAAFYGVDENAPDSEIREKQAKALEMVRKYAYGSKDIPRPCVLPELPR